MSPSPDHTNRLLDCLAPEDAQRIIGASQSVELPLRLQIYGNEITPRYLYLLTTGIASVVFTSEQGIRVELATLGNEGMVGWIYLLGSHASPMDCMMQVSGEGYRVPLAVAQREFNENVSFRTALLEYVQHQSILANQIVACNRLHRAEARFARWLLMVQDRLHSDTMHMTQEFLSNMLGTRRTTVVEVSAILQQAGAIENRRGLVRILDRAKLEGFACECYPRLNKLLHDLYADRGAGKLARNGSGHSF